MILSSPNYPKWYNADGVGCEWLISSPEGFIIALEFYHFHVSNLLYFVKMDFIKSLEQFVIVIFTHLSYLIILVLILYHSMMELVIKPKN